MHQGHPGSVFVQWWIIEWRLVHQTVVPQVHAAGVTLVHAWERKFLWAIRINSTLQLSQKKNYQRYIKNVSTIILILLLLTSSWRTSWVRSSAVVEHREVSSGSIALRIVQTPAKSKSFEQRSRRADSETSPRRLGTWTNLSVQVYKFNKVEWKVSSIIPPTMLL